MNGLDLLIKYENEGLDTEEEVMELRDFLVDSGLVNSTGSFQRFVRSVDEWAAQDS